MICLGLIGLGQAAQILHIPNIEKMENKFEITAVATGSPSPLGLPYLAKFAQYRTMALERS